LPLAEKARVEVYIPDLLEEAYQKLLEVFEQEFTYTFGGCTVSRGLSGSFQSQIGAVVPDRINLIYTDTPFSLEESLPLLSTYADKLRQAALRMLNEEAVLVVVMKVYHSE
jgi:hypothetical protein